MIRNLPSSNALLVAIRAKCMDCSGNMRGIVERCGMKECPLYPYRSTKAIGAGRERDVSIKGQMNLFEVLKKEAWV